MSLEHLVTCDFCCRRVIVPSAEPLDESLATAGWMAAPDAADEHWCDQCVNPLKEKK